MQQQRQRTYHYSNSVKYFRWFCTAPYLLLKSTINYKNYYHLQREICITFRCVTMQRFLLPLIPTPSYITKCYIQTCCATNRCTFPTSKCPIFQRTSKCNSDTSQHPPSPFQCTYPTSNRSIFQYTYTSQCTLAVS